MEFLLIALIVFLSVFLIWNIADTVRKRDETILMWQKAYADVVIENELLKLGVMK